MGGKGSPPPAPDYVGAAQLQGELSKEALNMQNFANRPTINTPFGSQTWGSQAATDPATGQKVTSWTQNTTLAPGLESALNAQIGTQLGRSQLAGDFMGRVRSEYAQPFNWQNLPQMAQLNAPSQLTSTVADYSPGLSTDVSARTGQLQTGVQQQRNVSAMLPAQWSNYTPEQKINWFNSNNVTPDELQRAGVDSGDVQWMRESGYNAPAFNFGGPQRSVSPMTANMQTQFDSMQPDVKRNVSLTRNIQQMLPPDWGSLNAQEKINWFNQNNVTLEELNASNINQRDIDWMMSNGYRGPTQTVQRQLATQDNPALPQFDSSYRDTVARSLMERMQPVHERQQNQLETQLANMGFSVGTEGYTRALADLQQRQAAERYNALDAAGQEAQRLFQMGMGARQQAFQEDVTGGQFANQATQQAFGQGLAANQFANQATQQAFNQAMTAGQAGNQAIGQQFGQNLNAAQFGNQAQNQLFGQLMGQADLANRATGQQFQQDLASQQFRNQALGQAGALDMQRMQAQNAALAQQQALNQQFADQQNRLRQQAIAEQQLRRGMSLNEMNALLSGQQVQMPTMPSFTASGRAETPNILGATQAGYDAALGAYNAEQAASNNMLGGLFSLGGAALSNPFIFSDRRLKRGIKRIGTHPIGVGLYEYTMLGYPQGGVIAQEVQAVRPDLVKRHQNGYLMVNYGSL